MNKEISNSLIGRENLIWKEHFTGENLPPLQTQFQATHKPVGMTIRNNILYRFEHGYVKSAVLKLRKLENLDHIILYNGTIKVDTIYPWMFPALEHVYGITLFDGETLQLPFDQLMGNNYLITNNSSICVCLKYETEIAIELEYTHLHTWISTKSPYFWYASNLYTGLQELTTESTCEDTNRTYEVSLNFTHPLYCLYFTIIGAKPIKATISINNRPFYTTEPHKVNNSNMYYISLTTENSPLQSYDLQKTPLNASQAEIITMKLEFDERYDPETEINVAAIAYQNMILANSTQPSSASGSNKVAIGYNALTSNTTGSNSVLIGQNALMANTTGSNKTAIGNAALTSISSTSNTAIGYKAQRGIW